jgi:hypothetical protein
MQITWKSIGHSPSMWIDNSDALWASADLVQRRYERAWEQGLKLQAKLSNWTYAGKFNPQDPDSWTEVQAKTKAKFDEVKPLSNSARVAAMLRAQSLEAELKAAYYKRAVNKAGHVDKIESIKTHDMIKLAETIGMNLTEDDRHTLSWAQIFLQLGRYPIADIGKGADQKHIFNFGTNPVADALVREKIKTYSRP